MSKVLIKDSTLTNIAEAIRKKQPVYTPLPMLPSEMPRYIANIDTEKVMIDGHRAAEKMNLYSFQNQVVLDIETPPAAPSGYTYQGKLYDGSKLYMKTTLTRVTDGSSDSSAGCTGTVLLIKPNGTQLSVDIPTYTIPSRSETGSSSTDSYYEYSCTLYFSPDENVYLRLQRYFRGSDSTTYYQSIYKLNITSVLRWTNKVIEVAGGANKYIIEDNYIYAADSYENDTYYIYGYKYGDTSYKFQRISTNSNPSTIFVRKNTNTYISFSGSNWISVTRNSDDTYTESKGTAPLNIHSTWKPFMLNGEVYVWILGYYENSGGFHIYKLNSDNSAWEVVYNIENGTSYDTKVTTYLNNAPDTIFQGDFQHAIRYNGTFDFIEFLPRTLQSSQITYTVPRKNFETWYYLDYGYNDIGQKIFFFRVVLKELPGYEAKYKCVIEAIDGSPVLYSTFRESDIMGNTTII